MNLSEPNRILGEVTARPADIAACMRQRPRVQLGADFECSQERAFVVFQDLWTNPQGPVGGLSCVLQPASRLQTSRGEVGRPLEVIVRWVLSIILAHIVLEFLHRDDDGARRECGLCFKARPRTCVLSCRHQVCEVCARQMRSGLAETAALTWLRCPWCREDKAALVQDC